ncbi:hypothetical protein [Tellurirhabdus rosea]|uniref:hypothetical protein n=1 Tax=Tellurirhabdus rosea TaxID=2674997 RepID=UPI002254E864|nr:hypothetical protein [Tellurirhabdus rosea]
MPAEKAFDFTNLATDLQRTVEEMGGGMVIVNAMMDGVAALRNDFTVRTIRDQGALLSVKFLDAWKAASDSFEGRKIMEVKSRKASFTEADIDIEIKLSDIKDYYNSYLGWLRAPNTTLKQATETPFELFMIQEVIKNHFAFIRTKTAWKGVYNTTNIGAENITDGFNVKTTAGRGVGGDISTGHVFTAATTIDATNAYAQVNGVADLVKSARPELLNMPMNCYLSQSLYDFYRQNRRTLFPQWVGPAEKPTELDDYSNVTLVVDPGLAGKQTIAVTPKENLQFIGNEAPGEYSLNIVRQVKSWQMSIRVSLGFDYASPDLLFINNKI